MQSHDDYIADLVSEFLDEAEESLSSAVFLTLSLKDAPSRENVDEIYRILHSLKGHCAILGFFTMKSIAHALEDVFSAYRSADEFFMSPEVLQPCLDAYDSLSFILGRLRRGKPETGYDNEFDDVLSAIKTLPVCN